MDFSTQLLLLTMPGVEAGVSKAGVAGEGTVATQSTLRALSKLSLTLDVGPDTLAPATTGESGSKGRTAAGACKTLPVCLDSLLCLLSQPSSNTLSSAPCCDLVCLAPSMVPLRLPS
jgi:hypothetical protein